jgi:hypothetical protein
MREVVKLALENKSFQSYLQLKVSRSHTMLVERD